MNKNMMREVDDTLSNECGKPAYCTVGNTNALHGLLGLQPGPPFICPELLVHVIYRAFHRFGQAKICNGGLALGSSEFLLLPQLPQKMTLASKVVKNDSKIVISLH